MFHPNLSGFPHHLVICVPQIPLPISFGHQKETSQSLPSPTSKTLEDCSDEWSRPAFRPGYTGQHPATKKWRLCMRILLPFLAIKGSKTNQRPKSLVLRGVHLGANESHQRGFPATVAAADPWRGERIKWQPPHRYVRELTKTTCYAHVLALWRRKPSSTGMGTKSRNQRLTSVEISSYQLINSHKCHVAKTFRSHWVASGRVKFKLLWLVYSVMFSRYSISWMQFIPIPIPKIDAFTTWTSQQGPVFYQPWNLLI